MRSRWNITEQHKFRQIFSGGASHDFAAKHLHFAAFTLCCGTLHIYFAVAVGQCIYSLLWDSAFRLCCGTLHLDFWLWDTALALACGTLHLHFSVGQCIYTLLLDNVFTCCCHWDKCKLRLLSYACENEKGWWAQLTFKWTSSAVWNTERWPRSVADRWRTWSESDFWNTERWPRSVADRWRIWNESDFKLVTEVWFRS